MGASQVWSSAPAWLVIVVGFAAVVCSSEAHAFYAGGRDGWVLDPTESYNHWAGRNRFQVNDAIVFTHEKGVDSVLQVTEQDFDTCNTRNPVRRLQADVGSSGSSVFRLDRSGPFFFISSDEDRCQKGQKLYIIVMAVRQPTTPPAPAVAPAPDSAFPPAPAPESAFPLAPSPVWASAPENAHAPPPTAGASRLVIDEAIIGSVVGVIGALVLCAV
ncbi:early nodulin-like protein 1 [Miscanthus floridulus]|uniref:early nodulin-like protein 1 n=1 Tax=Miscanthus floridulus TaxID=154761 RepID=UPI0034583DB7